jgi:hypothetical protein
VWTEAGFEYYCTRPNISGHDLEKKIYEKMGVEVGNYDLYLNEVLLTTVCRTRLERKLGFTGILPRDFLYPYTNT